MILKYWDLRVTPSDISEEEEEEEKWPKTILLRRIPIEIVWDEKCIQPDGRWPRRRTTSTQIWMSAVIFAINLKDPLLSFLMQMLECALQGRRNKDTWVGNVFKTQDVWNKKKKLMAIDVKMLIASNLAVRQDGDKSGTSTHQSSSTRRRFGLSTKQQSVYVIMIPNSIWGFVLTGDKKNLHWQIWLWSVLLLISKDWY